MRKIVAGLFITLDGVVEAPHLATVARVSVALGARGSTRIQTLPALTIDEFVETLS